MNFPNKKYQIIYADPPWAYRDRASGDRGASRKYETQDHEWINNLPVKEIAAEDSVLFLWVTMPKLYECWEIFPKWGFEFKTCAFTWVKKNKNGAGWFIGMGNWTRANSELCLIGTKGKPKRISASVHSVISSPVLSHSEKPHAVRERIIELCGDLPRIELFSRRKVEGWDCWGNQINWNEQKEIFTH